MKEKLTIKLLAKEAKSFSIKETEHHEPSLYGTTDGKAVGTYLEQKFQTYLHDDYKYVEGNSAKGIDFPELNVDLKVTSNKQPQSSCPFRSARQKVYGLGYSVLVFVYIKTDNYDDKTGNLAISDTILIRENRTADYQTTRGIVDIIENSGNKDDILAFFEERRLPVDEIQADQLADEVLKNPPEIGYITISNALQWRLQYRRAINEAGEIDGIIKIS